MTTRSTYEYPARGDAEAGLALVKNLDSTYKRIGWFQLQSDLEEEKGIYYTRPARKRTWDYQAILEMQTVTIV
jgi:hypothetical protein